jgi:hypothetical protein
LIAEGAVIVVSILLAFGVDAWWDARQERAREESYLGQLAEDLESTLENNATFSGRADSIDWAAARLVQSYYEATPPHPDSVAQEDAQDGTGYRFAAHSEASPYLALGRLRQCISAA